ncbi:MAG TPA: hypothetical protein VM390_01445 [Acidimicrobiales bacterium]|nr:hypothetical protein [Acidimicrobiales bacterium]
MSQMTFVLFFPDGSCGLVQSPDGGLGLPTGTLEAGEDELDALVRIPLMAAGFRPQRFHPFRWAGSHLYAWVEGDRYDGHRPHRKVPLHVAPPEEASRSLRDQGRAADAALVAAAARSYRDSLEHRA